MGGVEEWMRRFEDFFGKAVTRLSSPRRDGWRLREANAVVVAERGTRQGGADDFPQCGDWNSLRRSGDDSTFAGPRKHPQQMTRLIQAWHQIKEEEQTTTRRSTKR